MPEWLSAWLDQISGLELVLAVAAIIAVIVWLWRTKPWRGVVAVARGIVQGTQILESVKDLPRFIEKTEQQLDSIYHETHFNNGSSIKDAVTRTESVVNQMKQQLDATTGTVNTVAETVAVIEEEIPKLKQADEELREDFETTRNPWEEPK